MSAPRVGGSCTLTIRRINLQMATNDRPQHNAWTLCELPAIPFLNDGKDRCQPWQQRPSTAMNQLNDNSSTTDYSRVSPGNVQNLAATPYGSNALQIPTNLSGGYPDTLLDKMLNWDDTRGLMERNQALWTRVNNGDQYTGPSSGISPISDMGLKWISNHDSDSDVFCRTIQNIRHIIIDHFGLNRA